MLMMGGAMTTARAIQTGACDPPDGMMLFHEVPSADAWEAFTAANDTFVRFPISSVRTEHPLLASRPPTTKKVAGGATGLPAKATPPAPSNATGNASPYIRMPTRAVCPYIRTAQGGPAPVSRIVPDGAVAWNTCDEAQGRGARPLFWK